MGLFSWKTADTEESIMNKWSGSKQTYILSPDGQNIKLPPYDGYGKFGEFCAYSYLAKINGLPANFDQGIKLQFSKEKPADFYPLKFSFNSQARYHDFPASADCPLQGHDWSL